MGRTQRTEFIQEKYIADLYQHFTLDKMPPLTNIHKWEAALDVVVPQHNQFHIFRVFTSFWIMKRIRSSRMHGMWKNVLKIWNSRS
ncbi:hypothetical protein MHH57_17805 [Paenibacillus sp. FSL H7-0442]|uniref:hypothetical protein n=1 Tax=Paenibacillus sp. FSL H7-0442 TaxID=2921435 RepID=UPI0031587AC1